MNRIFLTPVVKQILIGCIVMFIGTVLLESRKVYDLNALLAMSYPLSPEFKPWQIFTHMLMHGSVAHILFNMIGFVSIGVLLERIMGSKRFLQLFIFSGLGAITLHVLIEAWQVYRVTGLWFPKLSTLGIKLNGESITTNSPLITSQEALQTIGRVYFSKVVGASGALYGILVAFAFLFPNTELMLMFIPYPIKAKYFVPGIIVLDLFFGFSNFQWDPVAHFAHIGGAVTGLALVYYWRKTDRTSFW
jgi:rhomboid-like protein